MTRPLVLIFFPFMEMFNDIHHLLTKDAIRDRRVVDLYKEVSDVTREDEAICNNSPELNSPSIFSDNVHLEFNNLIGSSYQIENFLNTLEKKVSLQKHRFFLNFDEMS